MQRTYVKDLKGSVGQEVLIKGWADAIRSHGKLAFVDVRDITGKVQCVLNQDPNFSPESVVEVSGVVRKRPENLVNPKIETGDIELEVTKVIVLNECKPLPIPIDTDGHEVNEDSRLKYRYLDLRRERMSKIIKLRSKFIRELRENLYKENFIEVETPLLTKATKEGARNFIVPSRYHRGKFYALPQSPQQYKQLLMTAGLEKYFQIAKCIRDEDLRADRGYEFTQLDLEMSFVQREDVLALVESVVKNSVKSVGGVLQDEKFPVLDYEDVVKKYGSDKFDLRNPEEKEAGLLAFAWVINFPFFKKVNAKDKAEVEDSKSGWTFTHNPFSLPIPEHEKWLLDGENLDKIITTQYDLVCNGYEVGGGSIRAHRPELLKATYRAMGYSNDDIESNVGHMLEAFELGTPPHGGIALGIDRLIMLLAGESSLKETIAFPMTSSGRTAVMDAPEAIPENQLQGLGIKIVE